MISEDFVGRYLEKAKGVTIFNIPLEDLNKDELIACLIYLQEEHGVYKEEKKRQINFLRRLQELHRQ